MPTDESQPRSTRRLTILYIGSLGAVAAMSIGGQVIVQRMLAEQTSDVKVISTAQNQQMLSQKLTKSALAVQFSPDPAERQEHMQTLHDAMTEMEGSHQTLHQGSQQWALSGGRAAEVQRMLTELEPIHKKMLQSGQDLLDAASTENSPQPTRLSRKLRIEAPKTRSYVRQLLLLEKVSIQKTNEILASYNQQAAARVATLRQVELLLLGITLLVLLLEGILVFRPAVKKIRQTLAALTDSLQKTQAIAQKLAAEQEKSERLLLNILPEPIADRLKQEQVAIADGFAEATVLFADIVGFTALSTRLSPRELVTLLNQIFSRFDRLAGKHHLEKIKTIGDAYMVVGGLPEPCADHTEKIAEMALDMQQDIAQFNLDTGEFFSMRIGINSGPVIAGVIGIKKFIYDLWGDTVNTASRMESHGLPGGIQVTEATYQRLKNAYLFEQRGIIQIKGKGEMTTYWLKGRKDSP